MTEPTHWTMPSSVAPCGACAGRIDFL
uniref:Uncharacterized protein n=1 Tax=Anguilla anguilla TaxID=7936 RepID=A0A0E9QJX0_ANGAN